MTISANSGYGMTGVWDEVALLLELPNLKTSSQCVALDAKIEVFNNSGNPMEKEVQDVILWGKNVDDETNTCNFNLVEGAGDTLKSRGNIDVFPVACWRTKNPVAMVTVEAEGDNSGNPYQTTVSVQHLFLKEISDFIVATEANEVKPGDTLEGKDERITVTRKLVGNPPFAFAINFTVVNQNRRNEVVALWEKLSRNDTLSAAEDDLRDAIKDEHNRDIGSIFFPEHILFFDGFASVDQNAHNWFINDGKNIERLHRLSNLFDLISTGEVIPPTSTTAIGPFSP